MMAYFIKVLFSYIYFILSYFYSCLYKFPVLKTKKFKKLQIVSVGNLTMGGAGKTPFIIFLSKLLSQHNIKHAVVSRGYKKTLSSNAYLLPGDSLSKFSPEAFGDEPFMLFNSLKNVPVFVGNKIKSLLRLQQILKRKTVLLDDGYQTHGLLKNINILLLDCSIDVSKYKLFPLGFLREPLSAIKRADVVVLTKTNLTTSKNLALLKQLFLPLIDSNKQLLLSTTFNSSLLAFKNNHLIVASSINKNFQDSNVVSVCGIANPASFQKTLKLLNIEVLKAFSFPDHYIYSSENIQKVVSFCNEESVKNIITTKKDFYKIKKFIKSFNIFVVDVEHQIIEDYNFIKYLRDFK